MKEHKSICPEFIKTDILKSVYSLYLQGHDTSRVTHFTNENYKLSFSTEDIDEIIDFMNEINV